VGVAVMFSGAAQAYVLSGPHILDLMISRYGKAKRLLISQRQTAYSSDIQAAGIDMDETVRYVFPDSFRSDLRSPTGERVHVVARDGALTAIDGRIVSEPEVGIDRYKDILLYHSREALQQKLNWLGVNATVSSLGRLQEQIAFVIGAQYPDDSLSQLWIGKETFRPLRWLTVSRTPAGQTSVLEISYQHWQLFADNWYPTQITFTEDGRRVREIRVESVKVNPNFSSELFNLQRLKQQFQPAPTAPAASKTEGMGEIEKTIEEFKKIYAPN